VCLPGRLVLFCFVLVWGGGYGWWAAEIRVVPVAYLELSMLHAGLPTIFWIYQRFWGFINKNLKLPTFFKIYQQKLHTYRQFFRKRQIPRIGFIGMSPAASR
jgi:hypothetical protein